MQRLPDVETSRIVGCQSGGRTATSTGFGSKLKSYGYAGTKVVLYDDGVEELVRTVCAMLHKKKARSAVVFEVIFEDAI